MLTKTRNPRRLVPLADAAEYAAVHPRTLRRYIAAGTLPAYRLGPRNIRVNLDELDHILTPVHAGAV